MLINQAKTHPCKVSFVLLRPSASVRNCSPLPSLCHLFSRLRHIHTHSTPSTATHSSFYTFWYAAHYRCPFLFFPSPPKGSFFFAFLPNGTWKVDEVRRKFRPVTCHERGSRLVRAGASSEEMRWGVLIGKVLGKLWSVTASGNRPPGGGGGGWRNPTPPPLDFLASSFLESSLI